MSNNDILTAANIAEKYWTDCYIADDGTIFMPQIDQGTGVVTKTGADVYADYQAALKNPPVPKPTADQQQLAAMALGQAQQATTIAELQQTTAAMMLKIAGGK